VGVKTVSLEKEYIQQLAPSFLPRPDPNLQNANPNLTASATVFARVKYH